MYDRDQGRDRLVHAEDQEACAPESWVWLTFRDDDGFVLGVVIVRGRGPVSAMREAIRLECAMSEPITSTKLPAWVSPDSLNVNKPLDFATARRLAAAWEVPLESQPGVFRAGI